MIQVRSAEPSDASSVAEVGRVAFVQQYEGLVDDPTNYRWAVSRWYAHDDIEAAIRRSLEDPGHLFLVAELEGAVVGFLEYDEAGPEPELHRIYVSSSARGHGAGSLLVRALHEWLAPGATYVLAVVDGNDAAIRFYERHGLRRERVVSGHAYYLETSGIEFPAHAGDFGLVVMRYAA